MGGNGNGKRASLGGNCAEGSIYEDGGVGDETNLSSGVPVLTYQQKKEGLTGRM